MQVLMKVGSYFIQPKPSSENNCVSNLGKPILGNSCFLMTVKEGWNLQHLFWDGMTGHSYLITFCGVIRQSLMLVGS
jgi:hypothetical protein